jgi:hypothetical protein
LEVVGGFGLSFPPNIAVTPKNRSTINAMNITKATKYLIMELSTGHLFTA